MKQHIKLIQEAAKLQSKSLIWYEHKPTYKYPISPSFAQCVIGIYGYLWNFPKTLYHNKKRIYVQFEWNSYINQL